MEYLDILDEKGIATGTNKPYDEVHEKGLWHRAAHVWILNSSNEILLQLRAPNKKNFPNMWDISAAGHVSSGEDPATAALRETKEEIGLELSLEDLEFIGIVPQQAILNKGTYIDNEYDTIYLVRADIDIDNLKMQKSEVKDLKYIPISEFKKWILEDKSDLLVPHPAEYELLFNFLKV